MKNFWLTMAIILFAYWALGVFIYHAIFAIHALLVLGLLVLLFYFWIIKNTKK